MLNAGGDDYFQTEEEKGEGKIDTGSILDSFKNAVATIVKP